MEHLGNALLNKIGRPPETLDKQHTLPNYLVANKYQDPTKCIGEHSDDDPLFAAQTDKTTIFSFNTSGDTIFVVKLKPGQNKFAYFLGITKAAKKSGEWLLVFYAPENSVFVMGDYFQKWTYHYTVSHNDTVDGKLLEFQSAMGQAARQAYLDAKRFCTVDTPRLAGNLDAFVMFGDANCPNRN